MKPSPIDEIRDWWRFWSIRAAAIGTAIMTWLALDPMALLVLYNALPRPLKYLLPEQLMAVLGALIFGLTIYLRLVAQRKLKEKRDGK